MQNRDRRGLGGWKKHFERHGSVMWLAGEAGNHKDERKVWQLRILKEPQPKSSLIIFHPHEETTWGYLLTWISSDDEPETLWAMLIFTWQTFSLPEPRGRWDIGEIWSHRDLIIKNYKTYQKGFFSLCVFSFYTIYSILSIRRHRVRGEVCR